MKSIAMSTLYSGNVLAGKQALSASHRSRILEDRDHRVTSSVDFEAMMKHEVGPARVDYLIEISTQPGRSHAVEVHAFDPTALVKKKHGTIALLSKACPEAVADIASWQVIIQGAAPRSDIAKRFFADTRISIAGRSLITRNL